MPKRSKAYQEAVKLIEKGKRYDLTEAVELVKKTNFSKFDSTVEFVVKLNLDPRKAEQNLRGAIVLPHGTGKTRTVLAIVKGDKVKEAQEAGADYVGDAEFIEKIQGGWFDFDVIVATPDMMSQLGRLGRVLGPKGLMPNPKTGTVTMDIAKAVQDIKAGKVEYRTDKIGNIHVPVGKVSFDGNKLIENVQTIYKQLVRIKPATVKGTYVQNVSISSTMSPGIKINSESIE